MKRKLKVNDFFCGCGGMGIAFKNAGYEIAGAWDFDKYAVESYRANVGDHVQKADIKELHQADIPQADVWAFGFPCQDLSVAGKQRGMILKCEDCGEEIEINGPRAKAEDEPMFTLTAQDLHGVIILEDEQTEESVVTDIAEETGLLDPNGCGKTLRVGGGRKHHKEA